LAETWNKNDDLERVRSASDIVRVIGEVVTLKPKGREYVGLCPFHDDRNPSMTVSPAKQIYKCFVCGSGGDVFNFVKNFHKLEFREALEHLADRSGVTLTPRKPTQAYLQHGGHDEPSVSLADLRKANAIASEFFRAILRHPEHGTTARGVIERRGIAPDMIELFQVGAAPDRWDGLKAFAESRGMPLGPLHELGLLKRRDTGEGAYDALRHRVIFPIHDQMGRVIAFGGRKIRDEDEPKYLNSPDTRLFHKSKTLYGLYQAAREIQRKRTAIITEGYTDTIACHQGGFSNAVATLGTALTRDHAAMLRRLCDTVILLFDGDEAGQRAADRAVEVFFAEEIDVRICALNRFTDAKDPDELLKREDGAEVFTRALDASRDLLEYRFDRMRERLAGKGLSALSRGIEEELTRLVEMGLNEVPPVRRQLIIKSLASVAGVDESTIVRAIPAGRGTRAPAPREPGEQGPAKVVFRESEMDVREHLLSCVLCDGGLWRGLERAGQDRLMEPGYRSPLIQAVANSIGRTAAAGSDPELDAVLADLERNEEFGGAIDAAVSLQQVADRITEGNLERLRAHWHELWKRVAAARPQAPADAITLVEQKRQEHKALGPDRRVLPRPG
jgi:DNA primase